MDECGFVLVWDRGEVFHKDALSLYGSMFFKNEVECLKEMNIIMLPSAQDLSWGK